MPSVFRVGLVVPGAAVAVYGAASLTGGWLGTPPWWERDVSIAEFIEHRWGVELASPPRPADRAAFLERKGRGAISGGVVASGLALGAVGAWARRRGAVS